MNNEHDEQRSGVAAHQIDHYAVQTEMNCEMADPIVARDQSTVDAKQTARKISIAHVYALNMLASLTQGVATTNFSSDIIKMLYMRIYGITFDQADVRIQALLNWLSVAILIGSMLAAFTLELSRRLVGYNRAAVIGAVGCTIFNALQCVPVSPYYTLVMRMISGYFQTTYTMTAISIVGQLSDKNQQVFVGPFYQVSLCFGMLIAYLVLYAIKAALVEKGINIFYLSFLVTLVFSTAGALSFVNVPTVTQDQAFEQQVEKPIRLVEIFQKKYLKITLLSVFLGMLQQLTGGNPVVVYVTETFKNTFAGSNYSSVYGSLIITGVNIVAAVAGLLLIKKTGRCLLLYLGTALCLASSAMLIVNYSLKAEIPVLLIVASITCIVGFELGPGPVFFAYAMEVFCGNERGVFNTLLQVFNFVPNFFVILVFTYLQSAQKYIPFITYLVGMLVSTAVLIYAAPETKGLTKREIDAKLGIIAPEQVGPAQERECTLRK